MRLWPFNALSRCFLSLFLRIIIIQNMLSRIEATKCYSCDGSCHRNQRCNCNTGLCDGPYCFSTRTFDYMKGYTITKGCINRLPTEQTGCFADRSVNHINCYCDSEYCNSQIDVPSNSQGNLSCFDCSTNDMERSCFEVCPEATYCRLDLDARLSKCGYGLPRLPYMQRSQQHYAGASAAAGVCVFLQEGRTHVSRTCVCTRNRCNNRSLLKTAYDSLSSGSSAESNGGQVAKLKQRTSTVVRSNDLVSCYMCAEVSGTQISPQACRETSCLGYFCTLTLRTFASLKTGLRYERIAGCLNTTAPELVMKGCVQQWTTDREEFIQCACSTDYCNKSLGQAHKDASVAQLSRRVSSSLLLFLVVFTTFCEHIFSSPSTIHL